jgi:hypothetical protein
VNTFRNEKLACTALLLCALTQPLYGQVGCNNVKNVVGDDARGSYVVEDATRSSIVRINLAIEEPRIKLRLPGLVCIAEVTAIWRGYGEPGGPAFHNVRGEKIVIKLQLAGSVVAEASWSTDFPQNLFPTVIFLPATVSSEDLFLKLLYSVFTPEDLTELAQSKILEIRIAAVERLTDQSVLSKIATADSEWRPRLSAVSKLTDERVLAKIATEDRSWSVRKAAAERLAAIRRR